MDNNLHNHFEEDNLPDYLSWDNMEEGILSELEALEKKKKSKRRFIIFSLFLLLLGISSTLLYWNIKNDQSNNLAINTKKNLEKTFNNKKITTTELINSGDKKIELKDSEDIVKSNILRFKDKENSLKRNIIQSKNTEDTSNKTEAYFKQRNVSNFSIKNTSISKEEKKPQTTTNTPVNHSHTDKNIVKNNTNSSRKIHNVKSAKVIKLIPISSKDINSENILGSPKNLLIDNKNILKNKLAEKPEGQENKWNIGGSIGVTNWNPSFKGNELANEKSKAEKGLFGYSISGDISYSINKKWKISTGIEYQRLDSKLYYYSERDTSVLSSVTINQVSSISGNTIGSRVQDIEIDGIIWRRVIHYNKYQTISIPLFVSREFNIISDRFSLSTGVGLKYTLWGNALGKTLKRENNSSTQPSLIEKSDYNFSNNISALTNLSLNYRLNDKVSLNISTRANWFLRDTDNNPDISSRPITLNTQIGFLFSL